MKMNPQFHSNPADRQKDRNCYRVKAKTPLWGYNTKNLITYSSSESRSMVMVWPSDKLPLNLSSGFLLSLSNVWRPCSRSPDARCRLQSLIMH